MSVHTTDIIDPRTVQGLQRVLATVMVRPEKRLGQNFLIAPEAFDLIADAILKTRPDWVLEIGPGPGGLTRALLERGLTVVAIEVDPTWVNWLSQTLCSVYPKTLTVLEQDALSISWQSLADERGGSWSICGNLPYYITSPLLAKLFEDASSWQQAVFMVQKEVAVRLLAEPGQRETSALSVLLRYVADIRGLGEVSRQQFYPPPEVDSFVIQLTRIPSPAIPFESLQRVVRAAFLHRRKMIRQSLAKAPGSSWNSQQWARILTEGGIDPAKRAEALSWSEWIQLARLAAKK
ncbi:16S rRNA (adenine(1518)-N(6)/adenine(1519)-N(6))-dimethyltransferase RsmA [Sulfobacillus thermosulfidooxidans]|uniref:Ribosomal RNA small subunit methyltransferase A n=1 Tax=Sulfobacillus thermosulfidooxidans (strain DSM 9293 / VKM B-1269 / AT-1) TaxID=929705 RepID=A0A1W1WAB5_SULTA|nr:16S rRNA (adenine(1518)-N(6)/adenine(1519)-N(6))-dimethyltransferase RsmA [Sulfobacillus thermosulfidooxidans]SMC03241.1 16S rRNA (adenine1518-N6/adenine1519-N6)-dimethyltransferase [Sulfobacillus thermosulfidooxidans DSM 9293]